jgi:hypothetical protein
VKVELSYVKDEVQGIKAELSDTHPIESLKNKKIKWKNIPNFATSVSFKSSIWILKTYVSQSEK